VTFLAPLFLLGGLAVALPIVFHLIRRTTRERKVFSSVMFLGPSPPRLTRRSRLEHLLLLLLRCLVLCLLAVGFSRPLFKRPVINENTSSARRVILLVDKSASMRRANLWTDALDKTRALLTKTSAADEVALFTFDQQVQQVVGFEQWAARPSGERAGFVMHQLGNVSPGWSGTHLGNALTSAAEALGDTKGKTAMGAREIFLVSDMQQGSALDQLQGYEWPKGVKVNVVDLKAKSPNNASVQLLEEAEGETKPGIRVRVSSSADSKQEKYLIGWAQADSANFAAKPAEVYVPAGQSRVISMDPLTNGLSASRIVLKGDDEEFDNSVHVAAPEQGYEQVLYLGTDREDDPHQPFYFLKRAFQNTRREAVQVSMVGPDKPLTDEEVSKTALIVVSGKLSEQKAQAVQAAARNGTSVVLVLDQTNAVPNATGILGVESFKAEEATVKNYAMLTDIDFRHPLFAVFADPKFSDFTKVHFWKYRNFDAATVPGAHVLARFDNGDPAVAEVPLGKGRVYLFASGWQPEDSQLALSTKFVPLMCAMLESAGSGAPRVTQYFVGDTLPIPSALPVKLHNPEGADLTLAAGQTNFNATMSPGIYTVISEGGAQLARYAVNLAASESRTAPLPGDELERLGVPMGHPIASPDKTSRRELHLQNTELESRQKLWRWVLIGAVGALLFETWLAGRTARSVTVSS